MKHKLYSGWPFFRLDFESLVGLAVTREWACAPYSTPGGTRSMDIYRNTVDAWVICRSIRECLTLHGRAGLAAAEKTETGCLNNREVV
ncbi:hypothetical protein V1477_018664 [Vespula maculifrons]|uniref:Uncharacterized protein n=4 Tax=Vespula TaxID=7451 RepID=A0A834NVD0_VESGE|nr:hypothetical protein HZH66_001222 [Vespula vulgaris]KAF7418691.1 hypothetical protein HZH68_001344 [Vespula germanica]